MSNTDHLEPFKHEIEPQPKVDLISEFLRCHYDSLSQLYALNPRFEALDLGSERYDFSHIEVTLPSGDSFQGPINDLQYFAGISFGSDKGVKNAIRNLDKVQNEALEFGNLLSRIVFAEAVVDSGSTLVINKLDSFKRSYETIHRAFFVVHPEAKYHTPAFVILKDDLADYDDDFKLASTLFKSVRNPLENTLLALGSNAQDLLTMYLDNCSSADRILMQTAIGYLYVFGTENQSILFESMLGGKAKVRQAVIYEMMADPKGLPKEIKTIIDFIFRLEDVGVLDRHDPKLNDVIAEQPVLSKRIEAAIRSKMKDEGDHLVDWFGKFRVFVPNCFEVGSGGALDELARESSTVASKVRASEARVVSLNAISASRARKLAAQRSQSTPIVSDENNELQTNVPVKFRTVNKLPGGALIMGAEFADSTEFLQNVVGKASFSKLSPNVRNDLTKMLDELIHKGEELPHQKTWRIIKDPKTGKKCPIREVKIRELSGMPVSSSDSYDWRILYATIEEQAMIIAVHHKNEQTIILDRFTQS